MKFFRRKTKKEKLQKEYEQKLELSYKISKINRKESDKLIFEAEEIYKKIQNEI